MTFSLTAICHYAEWRDLFIVMLKVIMLSVVAPQSPLSVIFHLNWKRQFCDSQYAHT